MENQVNVVLNPIINTKNIEDHQLLPIKCYIEECAKKIENKALTILEGEDRSVREIVLGTYT